MARSANAASNGGVLVATVRLEPPPPVCAAKLSTATLLSGTSSAIKLATTHRFVSNRANNARASMTSSAVSPGGNIGTVQSTVPPPVVAVPSDGCRAFTSTPLGRKFVTVTNVAAAGPAFVTEIVRLKLLPVSTGLVDTSEFIARSAVRGPAAAQTRLEVVNSSTHP